MLARPLPPFFVIHSPGLPERRNFPAAFLVIISAFYPYYQPPPRCGWVSPSMVTRGLDPFSFSVSFFALPLTLQSSFEAALPLDIFIALKGCHSYQSTLCSQTFCPYAGRRMQSSFTTFPPPSQHDHSQFPLTVPFTPSQFFFFLKNSTYDSIL